MEILEIKSFEEYSNFISELVKDRFRVLFVIKDGKVQGYLDVTYSFEKMSHMTSL
nr:hypothetical protein [uncultured Catonella sp.]